jgi:hypothetical protein
VTTYYLYYEELKMPKALASTYTLIPGEKTVQDNSGVRTFFLSNVTVTAADWIELDIGFHPKNVEIRNVTDIINWHWDETLTKTINSQSLVAGVRYKILTVGGVNYTLVGAPNNEIGTEFIATGAAASGGTCITADDIVQKYVGSTGVTTTITATPSIIATDRSLIIAQNATTALIAASKVYSIVVTA